MGVFNRRCICLRKGKGICLFLSIIIEINCSTMWWLGERQRRRCMEDSITKRRPPNEERVAEKVAKER